MVLGQIRALCLIQTPCSLAHSPPASEGTMWAGAHTAGCIVTRKRSLVKSEGRTLARGSGRVFRPGHYLARETARGCRCGYLATSRPKSWNASWRQWRSSSAPISGRHCSSPVGPAHAKVRSSGWRSTAYTCFPSAHMCRAPDPTPHLPISHILL